MTWVDRCHWPGLEMAQGWVLTCLSCSVDSSVTWITQYTVWKWQGEPHTLHNDFPYIRVSCALINDPCSTFLKMNLLSWQVILALTTFQVPFFMIRLGQSKLYRRYVLLLSLWFIFSVCIWFDFNLAATTCLVSENYGKSFQDVTSLINNTFIRSEFGIAIGPENSGKVSWVPWRVFNILSSYMVSSVWILALRWSWQVKCLELLGLESLFPLTLERVSPTWTCPSSPWCRSHTTQRTPMRCWSSATM